MTRVDPPRELDSAKVLKFAVVSAEVEPTGATRGRVVPRLVRIRRSALARRHGARMRGYFVP